MVSVLPVTDGGEGSMTEGPVTAMRREKAEHRENNPGHPVRYDEAVRCGVVIARWWCVTCGVGNSARG